MGLSKKNPRGNFNWQNRILTRKAINCGQLTEPFDCGAPELQPLLEISPGTPILNICTDPGGGISFFNDAPGQTIDNTYTVYKDGVFLSEGTTSPYTVSINNVSQSGYYEGFVTNRFGCSSLNAVGIQVNVYEKPEVSFSATYSTIIPCIDPNPTPPPPILGDGFVEFTITNFNPAYTYGYNFAYDPGVVNYTIVENNLTSATFTIDKLCNIRYFMNVRVMPPDGTPTQVCSNAFIVDLTT